MICSNNYLADILRICEIKDLIWVMLFQSPLVYAGKENCTKIFQPFYKQIKKIGVEGFSEKLSTPIFFICIYFIEAGGGENLKIYSAWP